jgi:hypothetical protein
MGQRRVRMRRYGAIVCVFFLSILRISLRILRFYLFILRSEKGLSCFAYSSSLRISSCLRILRILLHILRFFCLRSILHILRNAFCVFCILVWVSFCISTPEAFKFSSCVQVVWVSFSMLSQFEYTAGRPGPAGWGGGGQGGGGPAGPGAAWAQLSR